jgi:hypothetical protein
MREKEDKPMKRQMKTMAMVMYLGIVLLRGAPTAALPPPPDDGDPEPSEPHGCLSYVEGDLTATPQTIRLGESVTLHWNVRSRAEGCPELVFVRGEIVPRTGNLTVVPPANTTYDLTAKAGNQTRYLATAAITVQLSPSDADGDDIDDIREDSLLNLYAPVLYMPFGLDWTRPANVDWYLARTVLRFHHGGFCFNDDGILGLGAVDQNSLLTQYHNTKDWDLTRGCYHTSTVISSKSGPFDDDHHFFLQAADDSTHDGSLDPAQWKVYGHVYKNSIGGLNLQYWFFYPYNDNASWGNHEGDWETIIVRLNSDDTVNGVYFCAHGDCSTFRSANNVSWLDNTHPVAWVADGSHASYPDESLCDDEEFGIFKSCQTADSYRWFTWTGGQQGRSGYQGGGVVNVGEKRYPLNGQVFIQYYSRWGELGEFDDTSGPVTPSYQSNWMFGAYSLPPLPCPRTQKCCEPAPDGSCDLCAPSNGQCP